MAGCIAEAFSRQGAKTCEKIHGENDWGLALGNMRNFLPKLKSTSPNKRTNAVHGSRVPATRRPRWLPCRQSQRRQAASCGITHTVINKTARRGLGSGLTRGTRSVRASSSRPPLPPPGATARTHSSAAFVMASSATRSRARSWTRAAWITKNQVPGKLRDDDIDGSD